MKVKQIVVLFSVVASMLVSGIGFQSDTAAALSDQQKGDCFNQWVGSYVKPNQFPAPDGTFPKTITKKQLDTFKASSCNKDKGGMCWLGIPGINGQNYGGQQIHCTGADGKDYNDGKYDAVGTPTPKPSEQDKQANEVSCELGILKGVISCDKSGSGVWNLLLFVVQILTAGVGLVAIGGFVYAAILYTTAEGNAGQVTKAKVTIFNVVLGLVLYALMWAVLQFLIPGGVFK